MGLGDGFVSHGKCEFDRHSKSNRSLSHYSGLKQVDKCGGCGSHKWETVKDELTDFDSSKCDSGNTWRWRTSSGQHGKWGNVNGRGKREYKRDYFGWVEDNS